MKKDQVRIGEAYEVKVSGKVACVRIDQEHPRGGWVGTNQTTGRQVRIKTARRLRGKSIESAPERAEGKAKPEEAAPEARPAPKRPEAATEDAGQKRMSGLDAAAKVLEEAEEPLNTRAIYARAEAAGYWQSDGQTPWATIYAAIIREIAAKGEDARFRKVERGKFELAR